MICLSVKTLIYWMLYVRFSQLRRVIDQAELFLLNERISDRRMKKDGHKCNILPFGKPLPFTGLPVFWKRISSSFKNEGRNKKICSQTILLQKEQKVVNPLQLHPIYCLQ